MKEKNKAVLRFLKETFPDAKCTLCFTNDYECLVAIVLSAQVTDKNVNRVTPTLFSHYPNPFALAKANVLDIERDIRSLGLYRNKAKVLQNLGIFLSSNEGGLVPHKLDELIKIPGVGEKTARVFLIERSTLSFIPVDTHLARIAKRLGYAKEKDMPIEIEEKLEQNFPQNEWRFLHHSFIEFGREICHSKKPECERCSLKMYCAYFKKQFSTMGK